MRKYWPFVLAIAVGLAVAGASFLYLRAYARANVEVVRLPVAAREIGAYEEIKPGDVAWAEFPRGTEAPNAARELGEVVGRVTVRPLARGWQIDRTLLREKSAASSVQVVAVNVDFARTGSAMPGDLVDVYWLRPEQSAWNPGAGPVLVAQNALVLGTYDRGGRPVSAQQERIVGPSADGVAVVTLAVKPEEARAVVAGAAPEAKNVALVKKFVPGTVVPGEGAAPQEGAGGKASGSAGE